MKQKLALACALMHSPELLLLDEPTTGVDPVTRRELWKLLGDLVAEGLTLIVATPYLDEAERCSRVTLFHQGRVLADAPPEELPALLPGLLVEVAATPRPLVAAALRGVPGVLSVRAFAARFHVRLAAGSDPESLRRAVVAAGAKFEELKVIRAGLEDTFLHLIEQGAERAGEAA
jgi:ABC-2 type transport system ATP-binding protein